MGASLVHPYLHTGQYSLCVVKSSQESNAPGCIVASTTFFACHNSGDISLILPNL